MRIDEGNKDHLNPLGKNMLKLVDHIANEIGSEELAQLTELSGRIKAAVSNSADKSTKPYLEKCESEVLKRLKSPQEEEIDEAFMKYRERFTEGINGAIPILDLLKEIHQNEYAALQKEHGISALGILLAIINGSRDQLKQILKRSGNGNASQHQINADNLLRLGKLLPKIPYDALYKGNAYAFMRTDSPNVFASNVVVPFRNGPNKDTSLIKHKSVLVLGSGKGGDDLEFIRQGARLVIPVENSATALKTLKKRTEAISGPNIKKRIRLPQQPQNMVDVLKGMEERAETVDTIYSHSSLHYFDDTNFIKIMRLIRNCLSPDGHLAFAIKLPGAAFDGEGIKLVEDISIPEEDKRNPPRVFQRTWLNNDGQIRHFRDMEAIKQLVEKSNVGEPNTTKLHLLQATFQELVGYDVLQKTQNFAYFIYKKITKV